MLAPTATALLPDVASAAAPSTVVVDTTILPTRYKAEPKYRYPEQLLGWNEPELSAAATVQEFLECEDALDRRVEHTTEFFEQAASVLAIVAAIADAKLPNERIATGVRLDIFRSPEANAFVLNHPGVERRMFALTGLFEGLKRTYGTLKAGHLAFIFGHELGHLKLGHYQLFVDEVGGLEDAGNGLKIQDSELMLGMRRTLHQLLHLAFTREQEFQSDELALRWMHVGGFNVDEGREVIAFLRTLEKPDQSERKPRAAPNLGAVILRSATATHPTPASRLSHADGVIADIIKTTIAHDGSTPLPAQTCRWDLSSPFEGVAPMSRLQTVVARTEELLGAESSSPNWTGLRTLVNGEDALGRLSLEDLGHVAWVVATQARSTLGKLPFLPYGWLVKPHSDQHLSLAHGLPPEVQREMEALFAGIREQARRWVGDGDSDQMIERRLNAFMKCSGLFYSPESHEEWLSIQEELRKAPLLAAGVIRQAGTIARDLKYFNPKPLQKLYGSADANVSYRAELLLLQIDTPSSNRCPMLVRAALENGLLDGVTTAAEAVTVVESLESAFAANPWWTTMYVDRLVGENLFFWVQGRAAPLQALDEVKTALLNRTTVPNDDFDGVAVSALRFGVVSSSVPLDDRMAWLEDHIPAGPLRNLLAVELLESEIQEVRQRNERETRAPLDETEAQRAERLEAETLRYFERKRKFEALALRLLTITSAQFPEPRLVRQLSVIDERRHPGWLMLHQPDTFYYIKPELVDVSPILIKAALNNGLLLRVPDTRYANAIKPYAAALYDVASASKADLWDRDDRVRSDFCRSMFSPVLIGKPELLGDRVEPILKDLQQEGSPMAFQINAGLLCEGAELSAQMASIPNVVTFKTLGALEEGEFRDYLVARLLAAGCVKVAVERAVSVGTRLAVDLGFGGDAVQMLSAPHKVGLVIGKKGKTRINDAKARELLELLSPSESAERRHMSSQSLGLHYLEKARAVVELFRNDLKYYRLNFGLPGRSEDAEALYPSPRFVNVVDTATGAGDYLFNARFGPNRETDFDALPSHERLEIICTYYRYKSDLRDRELLRLLDSAEQADGPAVYSAPLAQRTYSLFASPQLQSYVGEKIYDQTLAASPKMRTDFEGHLRLLLDTHPEGSIRRQRALKKFFDGDKTQPSMVRTWAQYDRVTAELQKEAEVERTTIQGIVRAGGLNLLEQVLTDPEAGIPVDEKADFILWLIGIKGKPRIVRCVELVEKRDADELTKESGRLTDEEKRQLIRTLLVGPGGILKDRDLDIRKNFLNHLFIAILDHSKGVSSPLQRRFKSTFDGLLYYAEPERAADFLSSFLVMHLEGKEAKDLLKAFFLSIPFLGPKAAQYLVSQTTLLPPDLQDTLMELTSRVADQGKQSLFPRLEARFGPIIRDIVREIGDWKGGGSGTRFYDVVFWNEEGTARGWSGVIGEQKQEVIVALPEDLQMLNGLVTTIEFCPEYFGGKILDRNFMTSIVFDTAREFDTERTIRIQTTLAEQVAAQQAGGFKGTIPIGVPAIKLHHTVNKGGVPRTIQVSGGPFLFMDLAEGETLDLFMKRCRGEGDAGQKAIGDVTTSLAAVSVAQWAGGTDDQGRLRVEHCDEHPGNVIVGRKTWLIDVGISVEIEGDLSRLIGTISRIAVGEDGKKNVSLVDRFKKMVSGMGPVAEAEAKHWISQVLQVLEASLDQTWDPAAKQAAVDRLWNALSDPKTSGRQKFSAIQEIMRQVGLALPQDINTFLRGIAIRDYMWSRVRWKELGSGLAKLKGDPESGAKPFKVDVNVVATKVALLAGKVDVSVDPLALKKALSNVNRRSTISARLHGVYDKVHEVINAVIPDPEARKEKFSRLMTLLASDREFLVATLGQQTLEGAKSLLRKVGEEQGALDKLGNYWRLKPISETAVREAAEAECFGMMPRIWRERIEPGMLFQTRKPGARSTAGDWYVAQEGSLITPRLGRVVPDQKGDFAYLQELGGGREPDFDTYVRFLDHICLHKHYDQRLLLTDLLTRDDLLLEYWSVKQKTWKPISALLAASGESYAQYASWLNSERAQLGLEEG